MYKKTVPQWQCQRSQFNHDWLKNEFLNNLDGFLAMLKYEKPSRDHLAAFLEYDFISWPQHMAEGKRLIDSFAKEMTPMTLLKEKPLKDLNPKTRVWLGELIHALWLCRYNITEMLSNLSKEFEKAVHSYNAIKNRLEKTGMSLDELKKLLPEFRTFRETCVDFSKRLSTLPAEVKYI